MKTFWNRLNPRERMVTLSGALILLSVMILFLSIHLYRYADKLEDSALSASRNIARMEKLRGVIASLPSTGGVGVDQAKGDLFSSLDRSGLKADVNERRGGNDKGSGEKIILDISFRGVELKPVLDFLHEIEYGRKVPNASVDSLQISRVIGSAREIYDIRMSVSLTGSSKR